jgi:hypothetical protein
MPPSVALAEAEFNALGLFAVLVSSVAVPGIRAVARHAAESLGGNRYEDVARSFESQTTNWTH